MNGVTIHLSGSGPDRLEVISYGNGTAYAVYCGEPGRPSSGAFLQDEDAVRFRETYESLENAFPDRDCRDLWFRAMHFHWPDQA